MANKFNKKNSKDKKVVNQIIDYVKQTGGLDYSINKMNEYHKKALVILEKFQKINIMKL